MLGGTGYLGARVLSALRAAGMDATSASRRGEVAVDVTRPETWESLDPFDLVVELTDTVTAAPDALIAWCLARGKVVLEATSEAPCVERLHQAHRGGATGSLVLGAGIFTGVSNLLGRDVAARVSPPTAVELVAEARGGGYEARRSLRADDGMDAAAWSIAAMVEGTLAQRGWTGARFIDDLCALEAVCARANALAGRSAPRASPGVRSRVGPRSSRVAPDSGVTSSEMDPRTTPCFIRWGRRGRWRT